MCAATYLNSTDVESMAKQQFANGDIVLSLDPANTNAEDRPAGINALQTKIHWMKFWKKRFQI